MTDLFVRQDIWALEQEQPWHPITHAYALAVREMRTRPPDHPTSWTYQTAVHWKTGSNPGPFMNQCQHNTWFFFPWHRMFLYWFEQTARSIIRTLPEVDEQTKDTWALPYWDYWDPRPPGATQPPPFKDSLPPPFRTTTMPNGEPNPLFEPLRNRARPRKALPPQPIVPLVAMNRGDRLPRQVTSPIRALTELFFSDPAGVAGGFGGPVTGFHHFGEDPPNTAGALEITPHGSVHNVVGGKDGLMTFLRTSPGDPIFWLHHANVDRLWEVWLGQHDPQNPSARTNPTNTRWTGFQFQFKDEHDQPVTRIKTPGEVVDLARLGFRYADVSLPAELQEAVPMPLEPAPDRPPELVGATDQPLELTGDRATVRFPVSRPAGPLSRTEAATPARVYLVVEDVEADTNPGIVYAVFANVPDDDDDPTNDAHYVGNLSLFGIESSRDLDQDHAGGLRFAFDITDLYTELRGQGRWNEEQVTVTFEPLGLVPAGDAEAAEADLELDVAEDEEEIVPPVTVGRVSLFYQ
jgi:tyrosinase